MFLWGCIAVSDLMHLNFVQEGHRVTLNVYDLSQGLAKQMSMAFIGKAIEGIW